MTTETAPWAKTVVHFLEAGTTMSALTPAAELLVLDAILNIEDTWRPQGFAAYAVKSFAPSAARAQLAEACGVTEPEQDHPGPPTTITAGARADVRAIVVAIPFGIHVDFVTDTFNLIAEADDDTHHLLILLASMWASSTEMTFGDLLDAYAAAAGKHSC